MDHVRNATSLRGRAIYGHLIHPWTFICKIYAVRKPAMGWGEDHMQKGDRRNRIQEEYIAGGISRHLSS